MAGNTVGGKRAAITNTRKYGADWYSRIGHIGGTRGHTGGFYGNRELARICGSLGGSIGRRGPHKLSYRQKQEIQRSYKKLLAIHLKAQRDRQALAA